MCADGWSDGWYCQYEGPHWFHTADKKIWEFLTTWGPFESRLHYVGVEVRGYAVPLPLNSRSVEVAGPFTAEDILALVFRPYSERMWGQKWEDISEDIRDRVPKFREGYDCRYFQEPYQGTPVMGFSPLFQKMVAGVALELRTTATLKRLLAWDGPVIFTGHLDELYGYCAGRLPYRGVTSKCQQPGREVLNGFHTLKTPTSDWRLWVADLGEFAGAAHGKGLISSGVPDVGKRTHPVVGSKEGEGLYRTYLKLLDGAAGNIIPAGRCGRYRYMNMDDAVRDGLRAAEEAEVLLGG
jgi:UDP-galactopyranose mutase